MRRLDLSLVVLLAAASVGEVQSQESSNTPDTPSAPNTRNAPGSAPGPLTGASESPLGSPLGSPDSATGGLRGVYGGPSSATGHLRGVYGLPQPPAPTPLPSTLAGSANSSTDNVPSVSVPGRARVGQSLPDGVQPSPVPGRPGYGRAVVNDRRAIIDLNGNRIVEFLDSPGQLGGFSGSEQTLSPASPLSSTLANPAQTPSAASSLSSTLAGSSNSSTNNGLLGPSGGQVGQSLPAGAQTAPTPYGASGYGQALINGRMVLYDLRSNRIIQVLH